MGGSQPEGVEEVGLIFALGGRSEHLEVGEVRDIFYYRIVKTEPEKKSWNILGTELFHHCYCLPKQDCKSTRSARVTHFGAIVRKRHLKYH